MGFIHVVGGPDHLSALATLSVGNQLKAFTLGVRWGFGHSFGLFVVSLIFFAFGTHLDLHEMGHVADFFVGFVMIILGSWYLTKAFKLRRDVIEELLSQQIELELEPLGGESSAAESEDPKIIINNHENIPIIYHNNIDHTSEENKNSLAKNLSNFIPAALAGNNR
eukprot:UN30149